MGDRFDHAPDVFVVEGGVGEAFEPDDTVPGGGELGLGDGPAAPGNPVAVLEVEIVQFKDLATPAVVPPVAVADDLPAIGLLRGLFDGGLPPLKDKDLLTVTGKFDWPRGPAKPAPVMQMSAGK